MRLSEIRIQNYRTITDITIKFPRYYTAICGKNDAGKSNIIRALRTAFPRPDGDFFIPEPDLSLKQDFTKWKEKDVAATDRFIQFDFMFEVSQVDDEGLFMFLSTYLSLSDELKSRPTLQITVSARKIADEKTEDLGLSIDGKAYDTVKAFEVHKRLQSTSAMIFHDSTEFFHPYRFRRAADLFRELSAANDSKLKEAQASVDRLLTKIAKKNQQDLTAMLGRLQEKYRIGLSIINTSQAEVHTLLRWEQKMAMWIYRIGAAEHKTEPEY